MQRGEVWWANMSPPTGRRPVLLLSRNSIYSVRANITVAPITRTTRGIRSEVPLGLIDGMPRDCVVSLDDIVTIRRRLLDTQQTTLSEEKMLAVEAAIRFALELP